MKVIGNHAGNLINQVQESSLDMMQATAESGDVGPLLVLVSAVCFGAMAIFGKLAYGAAVPADVLLALRFTVAAGLMGAILAVRPNLRASPRGLAHADCGKAANRRAVFTALGLGAVGYAAQSALFFSALTRIDASLAALVLYTYPVLVTIAAAALGRERLTRRRGMAVLTASAGTVLVLLGAGGMRFDIAGVGLAFGSAVTYTLYILVSDTVVNRLPPVMLSALVMAGASVTLGCRALLTGGMSLHFSPAGWIWVACIAVISTVVAMLTFFAGLARTGPSTASILSTLEPVVTTMLAALTLHDFLTSVQLAGGALVLSSVAVIQLRTGSAAARPVRAHPAESESPASAAS
jgi:drug/metabolite transporter (DMT)-like permease